MSAAAPAAGSPVLMAGQGIAAIQIIAGATIPAWFPALAVLGRQYRMWAAWRRLRPLWAVVSQAAPQVRLPSRAGTLLNARYRLHRRVIEIRDAELALRPYWDQRIAAEAADAAGSAGLPPETRDAVAEAAMIMTALAARQQGRLEAGGGIAAGPLISASQNDLASETARLLLVAGAIRRSPVVRALADRSHAASTPAECPPR